jgi:hypothetical protein
MPSIHCYVLNHSQMTIVLVIVVRISVVLPECLGTLKRQGTIMIFFLHLIAKKCAVFRNFLQSSAMFSHTLNMLTNFGPKFSSF